MRFHRSIAAVMGLLGLGAFAQETSYDHVVCTHTKLTPLESTPEVVVYGAESWGSVANSTTKEWENASTRCLGVIRVLTGKPPVGRGSCKWIFASGDTAVGDFEYGLGPAKFSWVAGTGRLKGIEGGGTFQTVSSAKPADVGTSQGCRRDWGKFKVPGG